MMLFDINILKFFDEVETLGIFYDETIEMVHGPCAHLGLHDKK
jgi:hypothetical protein